MRLRSSVPVCGILMLLLCVAPFCAATADHETSPDTDVGAFNAQFLPQEYNFTLKDGCTLPYGRRYNLCARVASASPLCAVSVTVTHEDAQSRFYPYTQSVSFKPESNVTDYDLTSDATLEGKSLDALVRFDKLRPGWNTLTVSASTAARPEPTELYHVRFLVESMKQYALDANAFRGNYARALTFFSGDPARFLFTYKLRSGGKISIDADWRNAYLVAGPLGRVHRDALPFFEKAYAYLGSAHVRVTTAKRDSGVLPLSALISKNDGTYCPRFTADGRFLSHHSLGTAIDLNASMAPNNNREKNHALIREEVGTFLVYNGVRTADDGTEYYDFTYTGSYSSAFRGVPKSVVNYLLYELAFYRAGFAWGYYYDHTCDAMHFTLTDSAIERHEPENGGLRKVFDYCD